MPKLKFCSSSVASLRTGIGIVDAQRTERRRPDQTCADRRAPFRTGAGYGQARNVARHIVAEQSRAHRQRPRRAGRSSQERPAAGTAPRRWHGCRSRRQAARRSRRRTGPMPLNSKPRMMRSLLLNRSNVRSPLATEAVDMAGAAGQQADDVQLFRKRLVVARTHRRLHELGVAAEARAFDVQRAVEAGMRIVDVVDRVVDQRAADRRLDPRAVVHAVLNGQRDVALGRVEHAVPWCNRRRIRILPSTDCRRSASTTTA